MLQTSKGVDSQKKPPVARKKNHQITFSRRQPRVLYCRDMSLEIEKK